MFTAITKGMLSDNLSILLSVLEVISLLGGAYFFAWKKGKTFLHETIVNPISELNNKVSSIENKVNKNSETLKTYEKELTYNSGTSMKDGIKRITLALDNITSTIDNLSNLSTSNLDLMPFPIWKSDKEGNNVYVNIDYREVLEIDLDNTLDWKWTNLIHEDDLQEYISAWKHTIEFKTDKICYVRIVTNVTKTVIKCKAQWKVTFSKKDPKEIDYILGKLTIIKKYD